jgi:mediator of RNA polymerase II transcription subunit 17
MHDPPFTLRPRSTQRQGPQSISEFIQRANAEPSGFRSLDAAELRRQVEAQRNGAAADADHDADVTADSSDTESDTADTKDIAAAREDLLRAIHQTSQTSMFALDFISLLLSKENPAQAVATLNPELRNMVGIGTLGATMLDAPTALSQSRVPDNKMVAIGKRLMDLNKAADTALAASKRLQREIGSETRYWSEVLGVGEAGWQTYRLPHEPQTLGVKFGFSNTSPAFKNSGIAPLRRAKDGPVQLEHGAMSGGSKRLQVRILENGAVVGRSSLPQPIAPDAPLQDRVKEARDTVFAQELWHEINREGRIELDSTVRVSESTVSYDLDATRSISLQLVTPGEEEATASEHPGVQDAVANELCIIISLLLSNAHRTNALKRSEPSTAKGGVPPYFLLRPLITHYAYRQSVQKCAQSMAALISVLRSAGVSSSVVMKEPALPPLQGTRTPPSTALANFLLYPRPCQFDLTITPASRLRILLKPTRLADTVYSLSFLPPLPHQPVPSPVNPLETLCPPGSEDFTDMDDLLAYLHGTVSYALATAYCDLTMALPGQQPPNGDVDGGGGDEKQNDEPVWTVATNLKGIVDFDTVGQYGVRFDFGRNKETGDLEMTLQGGFMEGGEEDGEDGKKVNRTWTWPGAEETLGLAVKRVMSNGPRG